MSQVHERHPGNVIPETSSSPGAVPYNAPDSRLRLRVPGTANVCIKMYDMQ